MRRMTLAQILAGGIVVSILIAVGFYFLMIKPDSAALDLQNQRNEELQAVVDSRSRAQERVDTANEEQRKVMREWARYIARKSPPKSTINLDQDRWRLTTQFRTFRTKLSDDLASFMRKSGVEVLAPPTVPDFGDNPNKLVTDYFHYGTLKFPCAVLSCGTVSVRGTFERILRHVERWNDLPNYIALADGLTLQGTSPNLIGTYNLLVIVYPRGEHINADAVPWITGAGEAAGMGAMPGVGGMPGGAPTAPGGGVGQARTLKGGTAR
jgi:hypothetical protein